MFFAKEAVTYTPSIHEMRMEQLFPSSSYNVKNRNKINYDYSTFSNNKSAVISKNEKSLFKQSVESIKNFDIKNVDLFKMTPDTANDYYLYKLKKEGKIRNSNFSFYDIDGSINYLTVFSGIFSENIYAKEKAKSLLIENLDDFIHSQVFADYFSMIFSCSVAAYLFFNLFFNASTFFKYYLNFLF